MGRDARPEEALRHLALTGPRLLRPSGAALVASALLLGCTGADAPAGDAPTVTTVPTGQAAGGVTDEAEAGATDGAPADDPGEVEDGVIAAQGVVVPLPDGWARSETAADQGLIAIAPAMAEGEVPEEFVVAGPVERSPLAGAAGGTFEGALGAIREAYPGVPDIDEEVEIRGAERARLLRFDGITAREGAPPTTELVILAAGDSGGLWVFTYTAPPRDFDEALADDLVETARLAPAP